MRHLTLTALFAMAVGLAAGDEQPQARGRTPLDDYVQQPDGAYKWTVERTIEGNPSTTTVIKLRSQEWRTAADVDRTVWEHWLVVVKPQKVTTDTAFLMIGGGSNDRPPPEKADAIISQIAAATGSVVAELRMVPNQPLTFHGDGQPRKEDDLIGYAWDQFLETGDATWLPRLPMVKSVVRAMDCLQEWSERDGNKIAHFVVAGASKRGWTTWMTGAVDRRVKAIIPIVIDVVNVEPSIRHHAEAYGFWAEAIGNYYQHRILQRHDHPRLKEIYRVVDPYYYRDRLVMPKYVVNAAGDQFFCPDSSQFYFDELPGEKLLRYVPNADHGLKTLDAVTSLIAYYQMIIGGRARPNPTWTFEQDGSIRVRSNSAPKQVLLWQATNPKARDFRLKTIGKAFTSSPLAPASDGSWVATIKAPAEGWTAAFVELVYDSGGLFPLQVTTAVRVLPDTLPHKGTDLKHVPYEPDAAK
jgi:PhoPQ-activated pathogenicity-related protein